MLKKKIPLRVAVQGWFLCQPLTGIGRHTKGLVSALQKQNVDLCVVVPAALPASELRELGLKKNQIHVIKPRAFLASHGLKKWFWENVQVPAFFYHLAVDWEYYPYPCPLPTVSPHHRAMTVHDLILWKDARYQGNALKKKYYQEAKRTLIHMDQLFCVSGVTHHELGIPSAVLLPNAVTPQATKPGRLTQDFVYLGGYELRKRVPLLVERFLEYQKKHTEARLILVGEAHGRSKLYPTILENPSVLKVGRKSDAEVATLLKNAYAFLHASDSEGFNLPLLEALQAGTPAIVTDLAVNREVSKNTALFWDPSKKGALEAILKKIKTPLQRRAQIQKQKKAAAHYSWDRSARILIETLRLHEKN